MERRRVLFVDDDPSILRALKRLFWRLHDKWDMVFAQGSEAALLHLDAAAFDVVVCDLHMPKIGGEELLRQIGVRHPQTKRILLSGSVAELDISAFADCLLTKPCPADQLIAQIERL